MQFITVRPYLRYLYRASCVYCFASTDYANDDDDDDDDDVCREVLGFGSVLSFAFFEI